MTVITLLTNSGGLLTTLNKTLLILSLIRTSHIRGLRQWSASDLKCFFCVWNLRGLGVQCVHSHKKLFFVNCCGIFDSNYFQAVHHKISIKIVSNDMSQFSVGLILFFHLKKKNPRIRRCFYFPWINNETLPSIWQSRQQMNLSEQWQACTVQDEHLVPDVKLISSFSVNYLSPPHFELFTISLASAYYLSNWLFNRSDFFISLMLMFASFAWQLQMKPSYLHRTYSKQKQKLHFIQTLHFLKGTF